MEQKRELNLGDHVEIVDGQYKGRKGTVKIRGKDNLDKGQIKEDEYNIYFDDDERNFPPWAWIKRNQIG